TEDRHQLTRYGPTAQGAQQRVATDLLLVEVALHQVVVVVRSRLDQLLAVVLDALTELGGDVGALDVLAEVVGVDDRLLAEEVDHASELVLGSDGELHRHSPGSSPSE